MHEDMRDEDETTMHEDMRDEDETTMHEDMRDEDETTMHEDVRDEDDDDALVGSRNLYFSNNFRLDGRGGRGVRRVVVGRRRGERDGERARPRDWVGPNADGTARGIETGARRRGTTYETTRSQTVGG